VFTDAEVFEFGIELDAAAIDALALAPTEYVSGAFVYNGRRYEPVGVRLKGNSTYQWLDGRPAWKVRFNEYEPELRFYGLERLTLDSNYWDGSMMAETLAYRAWRLSGNPAPRTGYANVSFNGELYGLYTIVEAMDDGFIDSAYPDTEGTLWEMCRSCDFQLDCSMYPLQEEGAAADPSGLSRACAAAASGSEAEIRAHFDWERLTRYFALERVVNHSDSYGYNRNNYYVYHDPTTDQVSLSPWGADSTFSYSYPPDEDRPCEPGYFDNLTRDPGAYLAVWCRGNAACWADVRAEMSLLADLIEAEGLAAYAAETAARLRPSVEADPRWPWGVETFDKKSACFEQWLLDRPAQVRAYVAAH
jgi:spore coat protein CotH